jgi:hypothetical protein
VRCLWLYRNVRVNVLFLLVNGMYTSLAQMLNPECICTASCDRDGVYTDQFWYALLVCGTNGSLCSNIGWFGCIHFIHNVLDACIA